MKKEQSTSRRQLLAIVTAAGLLLGACGGDDDTGGDVDPPSAADATGDASAEPVEDVDDDASNEEPGQADTGEPSSATTPPAAVDREEGEEEEEEDEDDDDDDDTSVGMGDPGDVLVALLEAIEAEKQFDDVTPLYAAYLDEIGPCIATVYADVVGPSLEPPYDAAGIRSNTSSGERLNGSFKPADSLESSVRVEELARELECYGDPYRAEVWDSAFDFSDSYTTGSAAAWLDYADCVLTEVAPTDDELFADFYYWHYDGGGTGGPLADDLTAYFDLSTALSSRISDVRGSQVCERPA